MTKRIVFVLVVAILAIALTACGPPPLSGSSWRGAIGSTEVTVKFTDETHYTCAELGDGSYSINWYDEVALEPSDGGRTLKFLVNYNLLEGTVDGEPVTLTRQ